MKKVYIFLIGLFLFNSEIFDITINELLLDKRTYRRSNAEKDIGFKMDFIGGNRKSFRGDNKYKIPSYPIYKNTTRDSFIKMVN